MILKDVVVLVYIVSKRNINMRAFIRQYMFKNQQRGKRKEVMK